MFFLQGWPFFIFLSLLFIFFLCVFIFFKTQDFKIFWRFLYFILNWILIYILFFYNSFFFIEFFFDNNFKSLIVKDPQEYIDFCLEISFIFSYIYVLIFYTIYVYFFIKKFLNKKNNYYFKIFVFGLIYYLSIIFIIVQKDLSFSSWEVLTLQKNLFFDFQPDLESFFMTYKNDFFDFFIIVILLFLFLYFLLWNFNAFIYKKKRKLIFQIFSLIFYCYFFGGDGLSNDFFGLIFSFIFIEILLLTYNFFFFLKRRKFQ
jgi:hypothetical protein